MSRWTCLAVLTSWLLLTATEAASGQPRRTDSHGDPLPEGALFRFGSVRLRHGATIRASALSPDGKFLATASDRTVVVWDLATGKTRHRFFCDRPEQFYTPGLAFSPGGTRLAYVHGSHFACVWDLRSGLEVLQWGGNTFRNSSFCGFTSDDKQVALSTQDSVCFYDLASRKPTHTVPAKYVSFLSPDLRTYVRVHEREALFLGDARTGKETLRLAVKTAANGVENGVAFAPDGKALAVVNNDKTIEIRELPSGKVRSSFALPDSARRKKSDCDYCEYEVGFAPDGKVLWVGTLSGVVHRWDLVTGKELPALRGHLGRATGCHFLPDGKTIITSGADGSIRSWEGRTGRPLAEPESYLGRTHSALSSCGRLVAVGDERGRVDLWETTGGKRLATLQREGPAVLGLAFAPDSRTLAVVRARQPVELWELPAGRTRRPLKEGGPFEPSVVSSMLFSPDGRHLCVAGGQYQGRLYEVATGKLRWKTRMRYGVFSPDSKAVVTTDLLPRLAVLDVATGEPRSQSWLRQGVGDKGRWLGLEALAFAPDGRRVALALGDGHISLTDVRTAAEVRRFRAVDFHRDGRARLGLGPGHQVEALAYTPDGRLLLSGGDDRVVRAWDAHSGEEVVRLDGHEEAVRLVASGPDGRTALSCGRDGQVYLWSLKPYIAPDFKWGLPEMWAALAAKADSAYRAVWALSEARRASAFLSEKIAPVKPVSKERIAKLIADLNSRVFRERAAAERELAEADEQAVPALEETFKAPLSVEVQQRVGKLLERWKRGPTGQELRPLRAVQALELAGTPEARAVLRSWAGGARGVRLTEEARAALTRLEQLDQRQDRTR
ncbi:MAG: WD40 repeat domain-containing protein [Gemmataceae bacterium]|nr:WD40 repeat domain-containing protein [Gemmataceae bacterium]